ncbi:MAG TPA: ABC transporter, partial [Arenibacter sp.]|nr:ABC transporter [Arenibacter sp.]
KNSWKEEETGKKLSFLEQKEYKQLEKEIKKLESQKVEIQNKFTDSTLSGDDISKLSIQLKEITDAIEEKTERWFELSMSMDE